MPTILPIKDAPIQMDADELPTLVNQIVTDVECARSDMQHVIHDVEWFREFTLTRRVRERPAWRYALDIDPKFVVQTVRSLVAEINPALLYIDPPVRYSPIGKVLDPTAEAWEDFSEALVKRETDCIDQLKACYLRSMVDSVCVMQTTWETRDAWRHAWHVDYQDETRQKTKRVREGFTPITVYDYPVFKVIPIEHFTVFPACDADLQQSPGVGAEWPTTGASVLNMVAQGEYDKDAVDQVLAFAVSGGVMKSPEEARKHIGGENPEVVKCRQTLDLMECYYLLPSKGSKPAMRYKLTIHRPSQIAIECRPNPWWHGLCPYAVCRPYPDTSGITGESVVSMGGGYIQDAYRAIFTMGLNSAEIRIKPPVWVPKTEYGKIMDTLEKGYKPGGINPIDDYILKENKLPQPFQFQGAPQEILQFLNMLEPQAQKVFPSASMGSQMSNDPTATEARAVAQGAALITKEVIHNCGQFTSEVYRQIHGLVYQFQGNEMIQSLWQEINPGVDMLQASSKRFYIDCNGLGESNDEQTQLVRGEVLYQDAMQDPVVKSNPDQAWEAKMYRLKRHGIKERDVVSIYGTKEQYSQKFGPAMQGTELAAKMTAERDALQAKNLQVAAQEETKRTVADKHITAEMMKLGLTHPLPEEKLQDRQDKMALEAAASTGDQQPGAGGGVVPAPSAPPGGGQ